MDAETYRRLNAELNMIAKKNKELVDGVIRISATEESKNEEKEGVGTVILMMAAIFAVAILGFAVMGM